MTRIMGIMQGLEVGAAWVLSFSGRRRSGENGDGTENGGGILIVHLASREKE